MALVSSFFSNNKNFGVSSKKKIRKIPPRTAGTIGSERRMFHNELVPIF